MIINHTHSKFVEQWNRLSNANKTNGAYFYSQEICDNIIPNVVTDRNWVTLRIKKYTPPKHSIVFIHNNIHLEWYNNLNPNINDYVLVCGLPKTKKLLQEKFNCSDKVIYLPLSVDVEYIKKFITAKTHDIAFAGRAVTRKRNNFIFDDSVEFIENLSHEDFLKTVAKYKKVYAIGRCALEAKVLGCEVLSFHPWFPDPEFWKVIDNKDAAKMLQNELDRIDGKI